MDEMCKSLDSLFSVPAESDRLPVVHASPFSPEIQHYRWHSRGMPSSAGVHDHKWGSAYFFIKVIS